MDSSLCCVNLLLKTTNKFIFDEWFFFSLIQFHLVILYILNILSCMLSTISNRQLVTVWILCPPQINEFEMLNIHADVLVLGGGALGRRSIHESKASWAELVSLINETLWWSLVPSLCLVMWQLGSFIIWNRKEIFTRHWSYSTLI